MYRWVCVYTRASVVRDRGDEGEEVTTVEELGEEKCGIALGLTGFNPLQHILIKYARLANLSQALDNHCSS